MDIGTISVAVSSLKTAGEIAKGLVGLRDGAMIQTKVIELQGVILAAQGSALDAQSDQLTLLDEVRNLKKEVADLKTWEAEKEKYVLTDLLPNSGRMTTVYAYIEKDKASTPENVHKLCANCFDSGKKSILQGESRVPGMHRVLACHHCGSDLYLSGARTPEHAKPHRRKS
ncbi:MAG: hypothetical protein V4735_00965 [Pseudomonadota bacterium]